MTVQTHPQGSRDLRLAARKGLLPARGGMGWLAGFANMFSKEMGEWFRTRRWLWQLLIWVTIINGIPLINRALGTDPTEYSDLVMYFNTSVISGIVGMIILAQDEIIQEKQSGTAAWILSKPAARQAFIVTKLLSNTIAALIFIVALPGLILLGEIYLATHQMVPLVPFLAGEGVFILALFYYLSLVIMLGVLFESRAPVLGIAFGLMFVGMIVVGFVPQIAYFLPLSMDKIALLIALQMPLPEMAASQVVATAVSSIVFVAVALWRFQHKEF